MTYVATVGINYKKGSGEARLEPGQNVPQSVLTESPWLIEQGYVEQKSAPVVEPPVVEPTIEEPAIPAVVPDVSTEVING